MFIPNREEMKNVTIIGGDTPSKLNNALSLRLMIGKEWEKGSDDEGRLVSNMDFSKRQAC